MLRSMKDLEHYAIAASDGPIGHVKDFYFDDDAWVIRYLVVEAGTWLASRKVLISPISVQHASAAEKTLSVAISKEQVRSSPDIDTDQPVSRQHEMQYLGHYGYPYYWGGGGMWGEGLYPYAMVPGFAGYGVDREGREIEEDAYRQAERFRHRNDDPHLRSCDEVAGYHLHASDGDLGHVSGFLIDDETWAIRYLVIDTANWWGGHEVLIPPQWISGVHWSSHTVSIDLTRASIREAPVYDPKVPWTRSQERALYEHYGRTGYWARSTKLEAHV